MPTEFTYHVSPVYAGALVILIICKISTAAMSVIAKPYHVQRISFHTSPYTLALLFFSVSFSALFLKLHGEGLDIDIPFRAEHLIVMFSCFKALITRIFMLILASTSKLTLLERHFSF